MFQRPCVGDSTEQAARSPAIAARFEGTGAWRWQSWSSIVVALRIGVKMTFGIGTRNAKSYPFDTFAIRKDRPTDDQLCSRCAACA